MILKELVMFPLMIELMPYKSWAKKTLILKITVLTQSKVVLMLTLLPIFYLKVLTEKRHGAAG